MPLTQRERIVEALRLSRHPLDDDELARRTGITPRQTVNQLCRALATAGLLRRVPGPESKIVNVLVHGDDDVPVAANSPVLFGDGRWEVTKAPIVIAPTERPPGSSREQREAERVMLDLLGERLSCQLDPARLSVASGARVEIDGTDAAKTILVECWAHQGRPKAAQRHKVLSDAFKLTWIASTIYPRPRLILCLSDPVAAAPFLPAARTWGAQALADLGIVVEVVDLPIDIRAGIIAAQERQYR